MDQDWGELFKQTPDVQLNLLDGPRLASLKLQSCLVKREVACISLELGIFFF